MINWVLLHQPSLSCCPELTDQAACQELLMQNAWHAQFDSLMNALVNAFVVDVS